MPQDEPTTVDDLEELQSRVRSQTEELNSRIRSLRRGNATNSVTWLVGTISLAGLIVGAVWWYSSTADTRYIGALVAGASLFMLASVAAMVLSHLIPLPGTMEVSFQRIEEAAQRVEREPEKAQPAWNLARETLELYFNRNLLQINSIFWLASAVMLAGFVLIGVGVWQAFQHKDSHVPAILAGVSGVVTQFIGATFLYIYRSTMRQADEYVRQLERMNTIGMAMQILDTMKDDASDTNLKDKTKAMLIDLFVRHAHSAALATPHNPPQAARPAGG